MRASEKESPSFIKYLAGIASCCWLVSIIHDYGTKEFQSVTLILATASCFCWGMLAHIEFRKINWNKMSAGDWWDLFRRMQIEDLPYGTRRGWLYILFLTIIGGCTLFTRLSAKAEILAEGRFISGRTTNKPNNYGEMYYADGSVYKGEWKLPHNEHVIITPTQRHGWGEFTTTNNNSTHRYVGSFFNDRIEGRGKLYIDGHLVYSGLWKNGLRNGFGKSYTHEEGTIIVIYEGQWEHNVHHGQGKLFNFGRLEYDGSWNHGKYHGHGKLYGDDGKTIIYEGEFKNGEKVE